MKKVLFGTTALVAAGMFGSAAQAAEPIKLSVGGIMNQFVGIVDYDTVTYSTGVNQDYNNVSIVSDTEVHFKGSTVLDNGLKVAVVIELEAERTSSSTARNADQQYVTLSGGWGQVRVGEMLNAAQLVHNQAPTAGGNMADVANMLVSTTPMGGTVVGFANQYTSVDGINNAGRGSTAIDYISPMFGPFAFGVTYTPTVFGRGLAQESNSSKDLLGAALVYADKWGPVGVKADVAYARFEELEGGITGTGQQGMAHGVPVGFNLSYAGFEVGGSYFRLMDNTKESAGGGAVSYDGYAWDAGIGYTTGPWKFAYAYYASATEASVRVKGKDKVSLHNLGGQYTMGPGVVVTANIVYQQLKSEETTNLPAATNSSWYKTEQLGLITGLKLSF